MSHVKKSHNKSLAKTKKPDFAVRFNAVLQSYCIREKYDAYKEKKNNYYYQ